MVHLQSTAVASLADVFREISGLAASGLVREYAVGGATAALFYAEPTRTYDIDVFVLLPEQPSSGLVSLAPFYEWAERRGFGQEGEHIVIHGVPVQFLPAHNALAEAAVSGSRVLDYDGVPVRVIDPEHLVALALQAGGRRRRERAWQIVEAGATDPARLDALLAAHGLRMDGSDEP
jgi:hypothetical protein